MSRSQLHTCLDVGTIEEMYSSGDFEYWEGTTWSGFVDFAGSVLQLAAAFFFDFPTSGLWLLWVLTWAFQTRPSSWWRSL